MEVKCFVSCTDFLLPLKVYFSYFKIQIFMLLNWNPNPESKSADFLAGLPSLILAIQPADISD